MQGPTHCFVSKIVRGWPGVVGGIHCWGDSQRCLCATCSRKQRDILLYISPSYTCPLFYIHWYTNTTLSSSILQSLVVADQLLQLPSPAPCGSQITKASPSLYTRQASIDYTVHLSHPTHIHISIRLHTYLIPASIQLKF